MKTMCRILVDLLILVFLLLFFVFLAYFQTGSLETMPTEERQEGIRLVTVCGMALSGFLCAACAGIRLVFLRKDSGPENEEW